MNYVSLFGTAEGYRCRNITVDSLVEINWLNQPSVQWLDRFSVVNGYSCHSISCRHIDRADQSDSSIDWWKYLFCAVEGDSVAIVPLAVVRLQIQRFAETVDGFEVVGHGELEEGPALLSINLWIEIGGGLNRILHLQGLRCMTSL